MAMRFQLQDADGRSEFWVIDADTRLEPALSSLWWEAVGGAWRGTFACPPGQAEHAGQAVTDRSSSGRAGRFWSSRLPSLLISRSG
jgi:hypothetical protein